MIKYTKPPLRAYNEFVEILNNIDAFTTGRWATFDSPFHSINTDLLLGGTFYIDIYRIPITTKWAISDKYIKDPEREKVTISEFILILS